MATVTHDDSSVGALGLPSTITYQVDKGNSQSANGSWGVLSGPMQKVGTMLRNAFYLPWYANKPDPVLLINHDLGTATSKWLMEKAIGVQSEEMLLVKQQFAIRDIEVRLEGGISRIFTVRLFVSKEPVGNKRLQLILFSYNGNRETDGGSKTRRWEPLTLRELSQSPLQVLKAFQQQGVQVDSFVATSLGNVALDCLKDIPQNSTAQEAIPSTLVINRGLPSVKKTADQLFSFPWNYLLYGAAKLTGWDANPEQGLLNFLENSQESENAKRTVVIIEATHDFYFSGTNSFEPDFHDKIQRLGASVFRAAFYPFPFHVRSHHALSLEHLVNNQAAKVLANTAKFSISSGEKASSLIAKNVFLAGNEDVHTCFYVCGNDATLNVGTVREALPLLSAFMEEAAKMDSPSSSKDIRQAS